MSKLKVFRTSIGFHDAYVAAPSQKAALAGVLSKAEARGHPKANVVTRAMGVNRTVEIETTRVPFRPGESILLCSDGLSRSLAAKDLIGPSPSLSYSADRLLGNALRRDGTDNATLVLIERMLSTTGA